MRREADVRGNVPERATTVDLSAWEPRFRAFLREQPAQPDAAHDLGHVRRVVTLAASLARLEKANEAVVAPAAWLHDCVVTAKDAPDRKQASRYAARAASHFLLRVGYPAGLVPAIAHAIEAHSFSAGIAPVTTEAAVVQDADRLDALGAVGIARAFMVGGALGLTFAHLDEPFPHRRTPDDRAYALDHFYTKLLGLADTMCTEAGRAEATRRTRFMEAYLSQLASEIEVR